MASSENRLATLFTEGVSSSAEGELAIDETTSAVSLVANVCVVPGEPAVVEEDGDHAGESGNAVSGEESTVGYEEGEGDDNDSFVDIMSGISAARGAESEKVGRLRRRWYGQTYLWKLWQRVLWIHLVCPHVSLLSSYLVSF